MTQNQNPHSRQNMMTVESNKNKSSVEEKPKSYWEKLREELRKDPKNLN